MLSILQDRIVFEVLLLSLSGMKTNILKWNLIYLPKCLACSAKNSETSYIPYVLIDAN